MKTTNKNSKRWESYSLEELMALKKYILRLSEGKRIANIPNVKEVVCGIIRESSLTPEDLGLKVIDSSLDFKSEEKVIDLDGRSSELAVLDGASIEELNQMLSELTLKERIEKARLQKEFRKRLWKVIRESGVNPNDIGFEVIDRRYKMGPKFKDPKTGQIWAGKGKTPNWLVSLEKMGRNRADFLISKDAS